METNFEALVRIGRELDLIENQQVSSAVEMYRRFGFDENDRPYWGYCVESACNNFTNESLLLIRSEEEDGVERTLRWVPRDSVYTWRSQYKVIIIFIYERAMGFHWDYFELRRRRGEIIFLISGNFR